jgi:hypothetical protein
MTEEDGRQQQQARKVRAARHGATELPIGGPAVATHDSGPTRVVASCPCRSALPIHKICEHCMTVGDGDGRYGTSLQLKLDSSLGQPCHPATLPSSVHTAASTNLRTTVAALTAVTPTISKSIAYPVQLPAGCSKRDGDPVAGQHARGTAPGASWDDSMTTNTDSAPCTIPCGLRLVLETRLCDADCRVDLGKSGLP